VRRGGGGVPRGGAHRHLRDDRPRRLRAPHATVVRGAWRRRLVLDLRQVPEGAKPRARPTGDASGRSRRGISRAARRDAQVRRHGAPRSRARGRSRHRAVHAIPARRAGCTGRTGRGRAPDGARAGAQACRAAVPRALTSDVGSPQARRRGVL
ncbi:MAG: hypothetical protein AVDCRST_MAG67-2088, partial [uncultured Solirubrobacteraceae bacterium]